MVTWLPALEHLLIDDGDDLSRIGDARLLRRGCRTGEQHEREGDLRIEAEVQAGLQPVQPRRAVRPASPR
mgnify:CR=1 FL=1